MKAAKEKSPAPVQRRSGEKSTAGVSEAASLLAESPRLQAQGEQIAQCMGRPTGAMGRQGGGAARPGSAGEGATIQRKVGFELEMNVPTIGPDTSGDVKYPKGAPPDSIKRFLFGGLGYNKKLGEDKSVGIELSSDHGIRNTGILDRLKALGYIDSVPKHESMTNLEYKTKALDELDPQEGSNAAFNAQFAALAAHATQTFKLATAGNKLSPIPSPSSTYLTGFPDDDFARWVKEEDFDAFTKRMSDSFYVQATVGVIPSSIVDMHKEQLEVLQSSTKSKKEALASFDKDPQNRLLNPSEASQKKDLMRRELARESFFEQAEAEALALTDRVMSQLRAKVGPTIEEQRKNELDKRILTKKQEQAEEMKALQPGDKGAQNAAEKKALKSKQEKELKAYEAEVKAAVKQMAFPDQRDMGNLDFVKQLNAKGNEVDLESFRGMIHLISRYFVGSGVNQTNVISGTQKNAVPFLSKMPLSELKDAASDFLRAAQLPSELLDLIVGVYEKSKVNTPEYWLAKTTEGGMASTYFSKVGKGERTSVIDGNSGSFVRGVLQGTSEGAYHTNTGTDRQLKADAIPSAAGAHGQKGVTLEFRHFMHGRELTDASPKPANLATALMKIVEQVRTMNTKHLPSKEREKLLASVRK